MEAKKEKLMDNSSLEPATGIQPISSFCQD